MKIKLLISLSFLMLLAGCTIQPKFPDLRRPAAPKTLYGVEESVISEPAALISKDGKVYVQTRTEKRYRANLDTTPRKAGFLESITSFFGFIGFWGVVALVVCFLAAPAATIMWVWRQKEKFRKAFRETTLAIKSSKAVDAHQPLHDALKNSQSQETKQLVAQVKADIPA